MAYLSAKQKNKLQSIKDKSFHLKLTNEDWEFVEEIISLLEKELNKRGSAVVELDKKCKGYEAIVKKQDEAIISFKERIKEIYGG